MLFLLLAATSVASEIAMHLKRTESAQSAAVLRSSVGAKRPAGWHLFEETVKSLKKTERGTVSMAQIRDATKSLSARLGDKVAQGPLGVERWIKDNLLPQASQTKAEMQHEVDAAEQKVEDCGSLMWSAEREVEHREKILLEDESGKYQCIAREHQLHTIEMNNCNEKLVFQQSLSPPVSINNVSKTPQAMRQALTQNYEFYNSVFPQFVAKKTACDDAASAAEAQLAECDADEAVIEQFFCKMKAERDQACSSYDACYAEQLDAMHAKIAKIQDLEDHVKQQFKTMSCFGHSFSEEGEESSNSECDPHAYETNHLDVNYPNEPRKEMCVGLIDTRRDYSTIVCDGETVVSGNASRNHGNATGGAGANATVTVAPGGNSTNGSL
jgi:hypothetical protein